MSDNDLSPDAKDDSVPDEDITKLVMQHAARLISEVKVAWPLSDGHKFTIEATRQLSESEFRTLERLIRMAKPAFTKAAQQEKGQ